MIVRASESQHWYTRTGEPAYTVKNKDGHPRPTTLRDARKLGLVPSVTTIIKCAASPGLEAWKLQQMMLAALTLPRAPEESEESFISRIQADSKEQAKMAAERGSEVHAALESFFETRHVTTKFAESVAGTESEIVKIFGNLEWSTEKSFARDGFGGKVDLHSQDGQGVVIDFKTKEFTEETMDKAQGFDEHLMQLASYRVGLGLPKARCANVFVSVTQPGLVVVREWSQEDLERGWKMFNSLLQFWYAKSGLERTDE
jgi:hypothetical protein